MNIYFLLLMNNYIYGTVENYLDNLLLSCVNVTCLLTCSHPQFSVVKRNKLFLES